MNCIIFPVTHIHVSICEITLSLTLPLSIRIISIVNVPVMKATCTFAMKLVHLPLSRIFSIVAEGHGATTLNITVLEFPNVLVTILPSQFSIAMSLPHRIIFTLVGTRHHIRPDRFSIYRHCVCNIFVIVVIVNTMRSSTLRLASSIFHKLQPHIFWQRLESIRIVPRGHIHAVSTYRMTTLFLAPVFLFFSGIFQHLFPNILR
mmetsp:Transcript_1381/g.1907  ORF Transcript_1381/g.1907 Transcript_1381/m.1907 type:complete len:204 (-) Transcript_1381:193-804(-)